MQDRRSGQRGHDPAKGTAVSRAALMRAGYA
jgi:hypothetical protein